MLRTKTINVNGTEILYFNPIEFDGFRNQTGLNAHRSWNNVFNRRLYE